MAAPCFTQIWLIVDRNGYHVRVTLTMSIHDPKLEPLLRHLVQSFRDQAMQDETPFSWQAQLAAEDREHTTALMSFTLPDIQGVVATARMARRVIAILQEAADE